MKDYKNQEKNSYEVEPYKRLGLELGERWTEGNWVGKVHKQEHS